MTESTFIFFTYMLALLSVFGLICLCVECYLNYKAKKYHMTVQNKVLTLQSTLKKGK
jgi:imidazoleglycerol phosphate dehydratase HisB